MNKPLVLRTVGTDSELFLRDKSTGEIISAEGYIKGSKHRPFRFDKATSPWFSTQLDNVLAEFTIPPAATANEFLSGIIKARQYIESILPANLETVAQASASLDEKYLMTPQAQHMGCEPDFSAYTGYINKKPYCEDYTLRSCGGHIHLGYDGVEVKFKGDIFNYSVDPQRAKIVQCLDLHVSVPLVLMEPDSDRKRLYGKPGAFRPKPYGLEYRTPSNWYLTTDERITWAFNSAKNGFNFFAENGGLSDGLAKHIENTINSNNQSDAEDLIKDFNLQLV